MNPYRFDLAAAEAELADFDARLASAGFVGESSIVAEIRKRPNMLCRCGHLGGVPYFDAAE
jgi:CDGSH-type Zn-finger protein